MFQLPNKSKKSYSSKKAQSAFRLPLKNQMSAQKLQQFEGVVRVVEANGEYEKLIEGCFENYLCLRGAANYDPNLIKACYVHIL